MSVITTILFDNDGVLVDTEMGLFESNREILRQMGVDYELKDYQHHQLETNKGSSWFMKQNQCSKKEIEVFKQRRNRLWQKRMKKQDFIISEGLSVLESLQDSYRLGLVTSNSKEFYEIAHRNSDMLELFDVVIDRDICRVIKPDPAAYLMAMNRLGVVSDECLVVEDSPRGIAAGNAAGCRVVVVKNKSMEGLDISMADFVIDEICQLSLVIDEINGQ